MQLQQQIQRSSRLASKNKLKIVKKLLNLRILTRIKLYLRNQNRKIYKNRKDWSNKLKKNSNKSVKQKRKP